MNQRPGGRVGGLGGIFLFFCFFFSQMKLNNSPSEDFLPVDGVEVADLVGLGRYDAMIEGGWRRRTGV